MDQKPFIGGMQEPSEPTLPSLEATADNESNMRSDRTLTKIERELLRGRDAPTFRRAPDMS